MCVNVRGVGTGQGVQGHRQDVLVDQLDGPRTVGDLVVEVVGQPGALQLQLLGLQGRLCRRLYRGREGELSVIDCDYSYGL